MTSLAVSNEVKVLKTEMGYCADQDGGVPVGIIAGDLHEAYTRRCYRPPIVPIASCALPSSSDPHLLRRAVPINTEPTRRRKIPHTTRPSIGYSIAFGKVTPSTLSETSRAARSSSLLKGTGEIGSLHKGYKYTCYTIPSILICAKEYRHAYGTRPCRFQANLSQVWTTTAVLKCPQQVYRNKTRPSPKAIVWLRHMGAPIIRSWSSLKIHICSSASAGRESYQFRKCNRLTSRNRSVGIPGHESWQLTPARRIGRHIKLADV